MSLRREFVMLARAEGANIRELCRRYGIQPRIGYKWLARYAREGEAGLADRSRRPKRSPLKTGAETEGKVVALRRQHPCWGGRKLRRRLVELGESEVPSASAITAILHRHGLIAPEASGKAGPFQRFERAWPNELWQMDFKGHFAVLSGRCHPLTVLDDHSRYALGIEACGDEQDPTVRGRLVPIFRRYGLPYAMLMDNGSPWGDSGREGFTMLTAWLMRLGVRVIHGRPYHPQTQGKDERFHRTLKGEVLNGRSFCDLGQCQRAFDRWRHVYNHERPHEALELNTPITRYRPSQRSFPEQLPDIEYGPGDLVRKTDADGFIGFKNRRWRVGKAFRRQPVALRHTNEDGVFAVFFCTEPIGTINLNAARGLVDIARAMPTAPQAQQPQPKP